MAERNTNLALVKPFRAAIDGSGETSQTPIDESGETSQTPIDESGETSQTPQQTEAAAPVAITGTVTTQDGIATPEGHRLTAQTSAASGMVSLNECLLIVKGFRTLSRLSMAFCLRAYRDEELKPEEICRRFDRKKVPVPEWVEKFKTWDAWIKSEKCRTEVVDEISRVQVHLSEIFGSKKTAVNPPKK